MRPLISETDLAVEIDPVPLQELEGEDALRDGEAYGKVYVTSCTGTVARFGPLGPIHDEEDLANAKAFAALPDILQMLEEIYMASAPAPNVIVMPRAFVARKARAALEAAGYTFNPENSCD
jgi:hypothetical protein